MPTQIIEIDTDKQVVVPRAVVDDIKSHYNKTLKHFPSVHRMALDLADKIDEWNANLASAPQPEQQAQQSCAECGPVDEGTALYCVRCVELMQPEQPKPVAIAERLPTKADADPFGRVLAFDKIWWPTNYMTLRMYPGSYSHWQPTGLTMPQTPTEAGE